MIEEILDGSPALALHRLPAPLLWSFSRFWSSFFGIEVLDEEEYFVLCTLYCYSLQQYIFLAFCNDFDTHYRMFTYILLRNNTLLFLKWWQKSTHPILCYSSVVNRKLTKLQTLKIRRKLTKKLQWYFFPVVIRRKWKFIFSKKKKRRNLGG